MSLKCHAITLANKPCKNEIYEEGKKYCCIHSPTKKFMKTPELQSPVTQRMGRKKYVGITHKGVEDSMIIHKVCLKGYKFKKYLAEGNYGVVYQACDAKKNCNYVIKIQYVDPNNKVKMSEWLNEIKLTGILSIKYDIGPKFLGAWLCQEDELGIIVAELWDGNLIGSCPSKCFINKLENQIEIINELGYVHGDVFGRNILVKKDNKGTIADITLTDFGLMQTFEGWKEDEKNYGVIEQFYKIYTDNEATTKFYFKDHKISLKDVIEDPTHFDKAYIYYLRNYCKQ